MDPVAPAAFNPHVQRVLKSYQSAAEASLSGPSRYMSVWSSHCGEADQKTLTQSAAELGLQEFRKAMLSSSLGKGKSTTSSSTAVSDKLNRSVSEGSGSSFYANGPSSFPVAHMGPVFLPMDNTHSDKSETVLEGQRIACFEVGGEKRLCLPQILNTVLQDFSLAQINTICDDLHIFCSRCNPQQLDLLKMTGVLPPTAPSCGLITKTDAERLCNALLHFSPEKARDPPSRNSFKVYHECFGKCKGVFNPELYTSHNAKCVDCCDCHGMFSPQKFVCHSHKDLENRTCHWGFDSANWRSYILLAKDQDNRDNMQKALDEMKDKFDRNYKKRRESPTGSGKEGDTKRVRYENGKVYDALAWGEEVTAATSSSSSSSAFRPWSPSLVTLLKEGKLSHREGFGQLLPAFLQSGPPVLLNPERVVPFSDKKRYDRHFAPNVSLAPPTDRDDDDGDKPDIKALTALSHNAMLPSSSPIKSERAVDHELSSSDESSLRSESVPSTPRDDPRPLAEVTVPCESDLTFDRDMMLSLVTGAMSADCDKEAMTEKILEVWNRQEDRVRALVQSRKHLIQEMDILRVSRQERLAEMSESRHTLRREVERLSRELTVRTRDSAAENTRLRHDMELLKVAKHAQAKAKYKSEIVALRTSLEHYERLNTALLADNKHLQVQLRNQAVDLTTNGQSQPLVNGHNGNHDDDVVNGDDDVVDIKVEETATHDGSDT